MVMGSYRPPNTGSAAHSGIFMRVDCEDITNSMPTRAGGMQCFTLPLVSLVALERREKIVGCTTCGLKRAWSGNRPFPFF